MHPSSERPRRVRRPDARVLLSALVLGATAAFAVGSGNDLLPDIPQGTASVQLELVADTGSTPVTDIANAGDGSGRVFVVNAEGVVRIIDSSDTLLPTPFLNAPGQPSDRAMTSVAFHPDYATNGKLYVITGEAIPNGETPHYSAPQNDEGTAHDNLLVEYQVDAGNPNLVDVSTRRELLRIHQATKVHNMNDMTFGTDGFLYIAVGDGGNSRTGAPTNHNENAQLTTNPFGSVLRIDVDSLGTNGRYAIPVSNPFSSGAGGNVPEIFAWGFRNPWRIATDPATGDIYVANNGDLTIETLVRVENGKNYGWDVKEGSFLYNDVTGEATVDPSPDPQYTNPFAEYDHNGTVQAFGSNIGIGVNRSTHYPGLIGRYLFTDWVAAELVAMDLVTGELELVSIAAGGQQLSPTREITGGQDESGRAYLGRTNGEVVRLVATPALPVSSWIGRALILVLVLLAAVAMQNASSGTYSEA